MLTTHSGLAAAGCVLLFISTTVRAAVLAGPLTNPANGHAYYLLSPQSWSASQAEAVRLGGNLATINDAAENAWVVSRFSSFGGTARGLWIGMNDAAVEGAWGWVSGEPVTYTRWGLEEPNNHLGVEDVAHIFSPGDSRYPAWNDAPDIVSPFGLTNGVVEAAVPEPAGCVLLAAAGFSLALRPRRRPRGKLDP